MPQKPGHAPGWNGHRHSAGRVDHPWRDLYGCMVDTSVIDGSDPFAFTGGLCRSGWRLDCPQAPYTPDHQPEQCDGRHHTRCTCPCHHAAPRAAEQHALFDPTTEETPHARTR